MSKRLSAKTSSHSSDEIEVILGAKRPVLQSKKLDKEEKLALEFASLGKLGRKFSEVIRGNIEMEEFKEYYDKRLINECDTANEDCLRNFAKMELFSLLLAMNSTKEWSDWLKRYKYFTPNPIIKQVGKEVQPLLFRMIYAKGYTEGDRKPLWILTVLAASGSVTPIYVHGEYLNNPPQKS